jgi:tetratricopeptide (TPR) repeat protein
MADCNRGGFVYAGLLACAVLTGVVCAETNSPPRTRDDKSALVNLAVQAVQQVQAQEQANSRALQQLRKETSESAASLRRLTLLVGAGLGAGILALALYARVLLRSGRAQSLVPRGDIHVLLNRAGAMEHAHRLEEALACYEQVLALDASLPEAYVGKGRVLNQLERYREALDCFEQATPEASLTHSPGFSEQSSRR